jgi:hypothetical protein
MMISCGNTRLLIAGQSLMKTDIMVSGQGDKPRMSKKLDAMTYLSHANILYRSTNILARPRLTNMCKQSLIRILPWLQKWAIERSIIMALIADKIDTVYVLMHLWVFDKFGYLSLASPLILILKTENRSNPPLAMVPESITQKFNDILTVPLQITQIFRDREM